ncbi:MAG TPA: asparagine synthase (glutamine-hydrolyzing) [Bryobacteraceae bacterium]|nr:asparagine synthase (glutamine-hydrolyzing) [Bryobacteraceae bacterium]
MCGIAGFVSSGPDPCRRTTLRRMVAAIRHRGPDDAGFYIDAEVGLAHARLSIIDVAGGGQPIHNEDGSLWIVFNGEIFNYVELRAELIGRGHQFATRSDTEVALHAFEQWGEACLARFNGQWAFAIWDARHRSLFLSRDRFGVRPLFFTFVGGSLVFASEVKALFAFPGAERALDLQALNEIFTFWYTQPPRTAFRNVSELAPGHLAVFSGAHLRTQAWWELPYQPTSRRCCDSAEPYQRDTEELLAILKDATRLRLRSDVPVGAYLSGGLDSSVIAALGKECGLSRLTTFSVRFEEAGLDEGPFQAEVVRHLGTDHRNVCCSNREIGQAFPDVIWHTEKPILRTAPAPLYLLSRFVRENGYKVVLTGEGADELLGGYDIFKEVKIRSFWARERDSRWRPALLHRLYPYMPQVQSQPLPYLKAFFQVNPADVANPFFSHLPRWRLTSKLKCLFSEDVKQMIGGTDPVLSLEPHLPAAFRAWDAFTRAEYLETSQLLPGYILSSQGDRMAMAHSVEGRFPFLDHRIAEFAARVPLRLKMNALQEKFLLKRAAGGLIPGVVRKRPKQPYRAPDVHSFFGDFQHDYVEELIASRRIRADGIFDPAAVQKLVEKARGGNLTSAVDNMAIVGVLSTQLVLERFIHHFEVAS